MLYIWIFLFLLILTVLFLFILAFSVEKVAFGTRCEGNPYLSYFTAADFENLEAEPIEFQGSRGQTLRGNLYFETGKTDFKALLIFCHGMGGGHLSYTTEIDCFTKHGFLVLAYDNTGTMASDGKSLVGMPQAVSDLKSALQFAKTDERTKNLPVLLAGHSWGAYTVCRAANEPQVKGVLSFSAPNDIPELLTAQAQVQTGKNFCFLKPFLRLYEGLRFGTTAAKPTAELLKDTQSPVLLLHGEKDGVVPLANAVAGNAALSGNQNIQSIIYPEKQHNVYASLPAEQYIAEALAKLGVLAKSKESDDECTAYAETLDFRKMCEEDSTVMKTALQFLDKCLQ
ncbi:MAG: alpha/beta hydrolase [Candidatus Fimenecus sp.]